MSWRSEETIVLFVFHGVVYSIFAFGLHMSWPISLKHYYASNIAQKRTPQVVPTLVIEILGEYIELSRVRRFSSRPS